MSKKLDLDAASIEEMWQLHEEISRVLSIRMMSEKRELEKRLAQLRREKEMPRSDSTDKSDAADKLEGPPRERRKYPRVVPKYRNPEEPSQTWSGRGKKPRWLAGALETGHAIDEFAIGHVEPKKNNHRRQRA